MTIGEELAANHRRAARLMHIQDNVLAAKVAFDAKLLAHQGWTRERRLAEWQKFLTAWDFELREVAP